MEIESLSVDGPTNMAGDNYIVTVTMTLAVTAPDTLTAAHNAIAKLSDYAGVIFD